MRPLTLALLTAASLFLAAASASAATFGEAAPTMVAAARPDCTAPAGAPGELFSVGPDGVRFLRVSRTGVTQDAAVDLGGGASECAAVATSASGAGVAACCSQGGPAPVGIVRDPGGTWSQPAVLGPAERGQVASVAAAVSDRGDAIVAWVNVSGKNRTARVSVVRRSPGGTFGAAQLLGGPYRGDPGRVSVGIAADGDAVVLWKAPKVTPANTVAVTVATAPAAGRFSPAVALGAINRRGEPSLSLTTDGHALVAFSDGKSLQVTERAPGGAFGAPMSLAGVKDPVAVKTSAALSAGGRALIAWTGVALGGVHVVSRPAGGAFTAPATLAAGNARMLDDMFLNDLFGGISGGPQHWEFGGADVAAALGPDGRGFVSWSHKRKTGGGWRTAANLATVSGGGAPMTQTFGTFDAAHPVLLFLADGTPALTWADRFTQSGYRMRLAFDGATHEEPALPRVRVRVPTEHTLKGDRAALRVPVECSGPCELRGELDGTLEGTSSLELDKAGRGTLVFRSLFDTDERNRRVQVRLRVTAAAVDGTRTRTQTLSFGVLRTGLHPGPANRVSGLRAVRHGSTIRVTFKMSRPQYGGLTFPAVGTASRSRFEEPLVEGWTGTSRDLRSFSLTLRPATGVRFVTLYAFSATPERLTIAVP